MGTKNKPGKTITPDGYVLIRVGKAHHLADVRGYAYEHRIVMEEKLGRPLLSGELVHHEDEVRSNNDPANLYVKTRAQHVRLHKPRLGTGTDTCKHGHKKKITNGRKRCRVCENAAGRERYAHGH